MNTKLDVVSIVKDAGFEWSGGEILFGEKRCTEEVITLIRDVIENMALFVEWRGATVVGGPLDAYITANAMRAVKPEAR